MDAPEQAKAGALLEPKSEKDTWSGDESGGLAEAAGPPLRRAASSRFSELLDSSVDYQAYRNGRRRQVDQQPQFDTLRDAEEELHSVLHDNTFVQQCPDGTIAAANVALAVDWFASALEQQFDGDEPFENADFLRLCCMFFASPLYENNARLVQRHVVKRTYAELSGSCGAELWVLLALLHLIREFQTDTLELCRDGGLFPLLQRLVIADGERRQHVLAMSLMFEIAQAVQLSASDLACATEELLQFLLDYVERMRYAESEVYNNTATKLVLALDEQLRAQPGRSQPLRHGPMSTIGDGNTLALLASSVQHSHRRRRGRRLNGTASVQPMSPPLIYQQQLQPPPQLLGHNGAIRSHHTRAASTCLPAAGAVAEVEAAAVDGSIDTNGATTIPAQQARYGNGQQLCRSRSTDLRMQVSPAYEHDEQLDQATEDSSSHPSVVAMLAQRAKGCKTFVENLVFLLNRETDPTTQRLVLGMLAGILTDTDTAEILYTNDLNVLTDIVIRELSNLSEAEQQLRQVYLQVVCALLRNPAYLAARHRLPDIELCLVTLLRQLLVSSQPAGTSRRGSLSDSSTRHSSALSDLAPPAAGSTRSGAVSPAISATSEETCCARPDHERRCSSPVLKSMRRPPPPPPPPRSFAGRTHTPLPSTVDQTRRRRPPPPPPSPQSQDTSRRPTPVPSPLRASFPDTRSQESTDLRPSRRRPPPPPPPPQSSRPSSRQCISAAAKATLPPPPPPPLPPRTGGRRHRPEHTGIRRQLSVKRSVSRYKRISATHASTQPPKPPPRRLGRAGASDAPISPLVEGTFEAEEQAVSQPLNKPAGEHSQVANASDAGGGASGSTDDDDDDDNDVQHESMEDSLEERRASRRLVADALRACHEARILASSFVPSSLATGY
ncbi:pre-rRNA processing [Coemansia guatemalensis]|uniref:Pre-rRNA processing n=1 Tax=Coemansia guatemalensis TaxID=2761395 RepID=A0A9W8LSE3_9FUNG|nr:pre-rRNA processing [Coemansia guatemalensis]